MNRRRLILTALGALAGLPFVSQVVESISAEALALAIDTVYSSREALAAIEPLVGSGISTADLRVTVSPEVSEAVAGMVAQPWVIHIPSPATPSAAIAPLIISGEDEMQVFLQTMAKVIVDSQRRTA